MSILRSPGLKASAFGLVCGPVCLLAHLSTVVHRFTPAALLQLAALQHICRLPAHRACPGFLGPPRAGFHAGVLLATWLRAGGPSWPLLLRFGACGCRCFGSAGWLFAMGRVTIGALADLRRRKLGRQLPLWSWVGGRTGSGCGVTCCYPLGQNLYHVCSAGRQHVS
jgi:hypothetical protein